MAQGHLCPPCPQTTRRANQQISVQPSSEKYSASALTKINLITPPVSPPEGRLAIVTNAGRDAVDATASASTVVAGRAFGLVSGLQPANERRCCGRRSRVVLTPPRWSHGLRRAFTPHLAVSRQ